MHPSVLTWAGQLVARHDLSNLSTLEVGSYNVNGSVRQFFAGPYIGVDMREGPGVDKVAPASKLPFRANRFAVVVSTEMLEHDPTFWLSLAEMGRVLKPGGYLILTARGNGMPEHGYPDDYYRFMPNIVPKLLELANCEPVEIHPDTGHPGFLALGRRAPKE